MIATIISEKKKHYPVLLNEIISIITPQYGGTFIDCTFGQGGYTKKILEFSNTKVIGIDRDIDSKNALEKFRSLIDSVRRKGRVPNSDKTNQKQTTISTPSLR